MSPKGSITFLVFLSIIIIIINLKDSQQRASLIEGVSISPQFHKVRKQLKRDREERRKEAKKVGKERGKEGREGKR